MTYFKDENHNNTFKDFMSKIPADYRKSSEYQSLLYLLSSNKDIINNIEDVFDFDTLMISSTTFATHPWQTGGSLRTVALAYNLFNGNKSNGVPLDDPDFDESGYSVSDIFDYGNVELYTTAIKIRYS